MNTAPPAPATAHLALALLPGYLDVSVGVTQLLVQAANALCAAMGRPEAIRLSVVGAGREPVRSAAGASLPHQKLASARDADVLVFTGVFIENATAMQGWVSDALLSPWLALVRERQLAGRLTAASCAGTWLMAEAGVLDARHATSVWWLAPAFRERYPRVRLDVDRMVVADGPLITAGAAFAHTDLMLHLIARLAGDEVAERCARLLMADRREWQTRHASLGWMAEANPLMRQVCRWIDKHLAAPIDVAELAAAVHLTPRTLARRCQQALGVSPWRLVQRRRIEAAAQLMRSTTLPFEKVALRVGYADSSALRALIRREFGVSPSALRA